MDMCEIEIEIQKVTRVPHHFDTLRGFKLRKNADANNEVKPLHTHAIHFLYEVSKILATKVGLSFIFLC